MTQSLRILSMMTILSVAGLLSVACTTSRPPVVMVEPSYSYLRDVSAVADAAMPSDQFPASELTRQLNATEQNQNTTPSDESATDASYPMSGNMMGTEDQMVLDPFLNLPASYQDDYFFNMARVEFNQP